MDDRNLKPSNSEASLHRKIEATEQILESKDYNSEKNILVGLDWNGPIANTCDSREIDEHTVQQIQELENYDFETSLVSGHPMVNLEEFKEILDMEELHRVGELGSMYAVNGENPEQVNPEISREPIDKSYQKLYQEAAEEEIKLLPQPNISNIVACVRAEAEGSERGEKRGGTYRLDESGETTEEIYQYLDGEGFEYDKDNNRVVFENNLENAAELTETLTHNFRYPGLRFENAEDGKIQFYRATEDDTEKIASPEEAHEFIIEAIPEELDLEFHKNDDYGVDLEINGSSKYKGMKALANELYQEDTNFYFHVGDKKGDIMMEDDSLFFPQKEKQAQRVLEDQGFTAYEDFVPVEDAAEYIKIVETVAEDY